MMPFRVLLIIVMSVYLSGCLSTPLEFFSAENTSANLRNKIIGPHGNAEKNAAPTHFTKLEMIEKDLKKVKEYMQELNTIRPQLTKIIAMEQDFNFMVEQLTGLTSLNNKALFIQDDNNKQSESNQLEGMVSKFSPSTSLNASFTGNDSSSSFASEEFSNTSVKLGAATSLSKFSEKIANVNPKPQVGSQNIENDLLAGDSDAKFSQTPLMKSKSGLADDALSADATLSSVGQSGIHLVSVSKKSNLTDYYNMMSVKFPDILANKKPLVELVNVNGQQFYSLRIGPYSNQLANVNCRKLTADGTYCGVVNYQGEPLKL
jgi:hypothetical protein